MLDKETKVAEKRRVQSSVSSETLETNSSKCESTEINPPEYAHFCISLPLSVKGLREPSKRRKIGQGPAGSLSSLLEDKGRLKLSRPLSLPCYQSSFSV